MWSIGRKATEPITKCESGYGRADYVNRAGHRLERSYLKGM